MSIEEWTILAEDQGFVVEKIQAIKTPGVFHDKDEMSQWFYALKPDLFELPVALQEEYFQAFRELLQEIYPQAGDGRIYTFPERLEITLVKRG